MIIEQFPQVKPLYQQVLELIEAKIISGEFCVGDKLPTENELASMYRVSRTVIREAMKVLKEKGWVETRVAIGTFVISTTPSGIDSSFDFFMKMNPAGGFGHLIEVRLLLEPGIAALAAERANEDQIRRMEQAVLQMGTAIEDSNDTKAFLKGDFDFHLGLAEATGNPLIQMILAPVVNLMRDSQEYHFSHVVGGSRRSQDNHTLIMEAIRNHNSTQARQHMCAHIIQVREDVEKQAHSGELSEPKNVSGQRYSG
jgi:GntR family transcriptional repressor for pyruvate dehydrogenase complex